jgi:hypothetical protein
MMLAIFMADSLSLAGENAMPAAKKRICALPGLHGANRDLRLLRVAMAAGAGHVGAMTRKSPLDDPVNAAHAWARYRQIMKLLLAATVLVVAVAVGLLFAYNGMISVHFYIAVALGISLTMLLGGGLMGLAFLSNGTGHDESVDNQMPARDELWMPKDD